MTTTAASSVTTATASPMMYDRAQQQVRALPRLPTSAVNGRGTNSAPPSPQSTRTAHNDDDDPTLHITATGSSSSPVSNGTVSQQSRGIPSNNGLHRLPPGAMRPHASYDDVRKSPVVAHPYQKREPPTRKPVAAAWHHHDLSASTSSSSSSFDSSTYRSPLASSSSSAATTASTDTPTNALPKLAPSAALIDPAPVLRMVSNSPVSMSPRGSPVNGSPVRSCPAASLPAGAMAPVTAASILPKPMLSSSVPASRSSSYHTSTSSSSSSLVDLPRAPPLPTTAMVVTGRNGTPDDAGSASDDSDDTASNVPLSASTRSQRIGGRSTPSLPQPPVLQHYQHEQEEQPKKASRMSRFKKAFTKSPSKQDILTDDLINGRGPVQFAQLRRTSTSSSSRSDAGGGPVFMRSAALPSSSSASTFGGASTYSGRAPTTATATTTKSKRRGLFSSKTNGSTDNLSLASTMSSASMLIRKLGNVGKQAKRTSLIPFKAFGKSSSSSAKSFAGPMDAARPSKSTATAPSHSFVVAEADQARFDGMTPAAALARQHQLQYAERERQEALERERQLERHHQQQQQQSQQRLAADVHTSDATSVRSGRFGGWGKSKSTDQSDAASISTTLSTTASIQGQKRRKWGFGSLSSSKSEPNLVAAAHRRDASDAASIASSRYGNGTGYEGAAPAAGVEVLSSAAAAAAANRVSRLPYAAYGASAASSSSSSSYAGEQELLESPMPSRPVSRAETYEASIRTLPAANGRYNHTRPVKGILKRAASYNQEDYVMPKPLSARNRANSYDAPAQHARPGSPGNVALVGRIPSDHQVDGLSHGHHHAHRLDTHPATEHSPADGPLVHPSVLPVSAAQPVHPALSAASSTPAGIPSSSAPAAVVLMTSMPYSNASLNASAPVLHHMPKQALHAHHTLRSASTPGSSRRIAFAPNLSIHTTWPATVYDRRAEPATCNKLTPALAQRIKEELNAYKMEEMEVHPTSRALTHFFV